MNAWRGGAGGLALWVLIAAALLGGCASRPAPRAGADGAPLQPPPGLDRVADAVPRVEPLRIGGPNKPYEAFGLRYVPMTADLPFAESGGASWYGRKYHGLPTSSGEPYDMYAMTAAHPTMPIPSYARVRNPANGREVIVRINDRGPFSAGRVIDLSYAAALKLGVLRGVAPVEVVRLTHADIRAGAARQGAPPLDNPPPSERPETAATTAPGLWLQLGAFRAPEGAEQLRQRVTQEVRGLPGVAVFDEAGLFRVQAGPFATREQAQAAAERLLQQTGMQAVVVPRENAP